MKNDILEKKSVFVFVSICVLAALLKTILKEFHKNGQHVSLNALLKCWTDAQKRIAMDIVLVAWLWGYLISFCCLTKILFRIMCCKKRNCEDSYGLLLNTLMFCRDIIVSSEKYFSDWCTKGRVKLAMVFFSRLWLVVNCADVTMSS